jgi:hypothetical protein
MLFDELKNKYPNAQLSLYGDCLIIPSNEFQKEWEKTLQEEGHTVHMTDYEYKSVYAVSMQKKETYKKTPFPEPPKESDKTKNMRLAAQSPDWDPREEQHLLKRWEELGNISNEQKGNQLKSEFPKRSAAALIQKHRKLIAKQEREQAKKDGEKPEAPKETTAATSQDLEYLGKITEILEKVTDPINARVEELHKKIVDLDLRIGTLVDDKAELEKEIDILKADFKGHEHSKKTGLPLVPP